MLDQNIRTRLTEIVGEAGLKEGESVEGYSIDGLLPRAVIFPRTPEEVKQIVILALEEGLNIIPWGGGTQIGLGALPRHVDLVVCLIHMDRVLDQDHENMSITVEAGIRLGAIQESLSHVGSGFFIPLDPPCAEEVTLGGAVATNTSGPSRFMYGTLRDLVLGIEVIIPEETGKGERIHTGGKTVKNVSGYDMSKLYIGSLGTLAIIMQVTCRILPLPEDRATVVAGFPRSEAPWACAQALLESQLLPTSIEVYNRETTSLFFKHATPSGEEESWATVGLHGIKETVEREIQEIEKLMRSEGSTKLSILRGSEEVDHWKQLGRLGLEVRNTGAWSIGIRVSVPISMAQKISNTIAEESVNINVPFYQLSHAGSGIVYAHVPLYEGLYKEKEETLTQIVNALREKVFEMGGSLVVEYAPPPFKERVDVWGVLEGVFPIMKCLKKKFDPGTILNSGRYVGGI